MELSHSLGSGVGNGAATQTQTFSRTSAWTSLGMPESQECVVRDAGVQIGALRRELPACLADAERMAHVQAKSFDSRVDEASSPDVESLTSSIRRIRVDSAPHSTCSTNAVLDAPGARFQEISSTPNGVEARGRTPHTIPSMQLGGPDFRDLARFEWRVRKTSRRDFQCVPI